MKNYEVVVGVNFSTKKGDVELKRFKAKVPANDDVKAYDKAMEVAEGKLKVSVISINEQEFVVPIPEEKGEFDDMIKIGKIGELFKKLDKFREDHERGVPWNKKSFGLVRELGESLVWLADTAEKEMPE